MLWSVSMHGTLASEVESNEIIQIEQIQFVCLSRMYVNCHVHRMIKIAYFNLYWNNLTVIKKQIDSTCELKIAKSRDIQFSHQFYWIFTFFPLLMAQIYKIFPSNQVNSLAGFSFTNLMNISYRTMSYNMHANHLSKWFICYHIFRFILNVSDGVQIVYVKVSIVPSRAHTHIVIADRYKRRKKSSK